MLEMFNYSNFSTDVVFLVLKKPVAKKEHVHSNDGFRQEGAISDLAYSSIEPRSWKMLFSIPKNFFRAMRDRAFNWNFN